MSDDQCVPIVTLSYNAEQGKTSQCTRAAHSSTSVFTNPSRCKCVWGEFACSGLCTSIILTTKNSGKHIIYFLHQKPQQFAPSLLA